MRAPGEADSLILFPCYSCRTRNRQFEPHRSRILAECGTKPIHYYLAGRQLHGSGFKCGPFRLGRFPDRRLRKKFDLDCTDHQEPLYSGSGGGGDPESRRRPELLVPA